MERHFEPYQKAERSIITKYRETIWHPFIDAVNKYRLIREGDRIAVCISGGKDSMLMAKCMQELERHGKVPFSCVYLVMDPGYNEINRQKIEANAELLHRIEYLCRRQQSGPQPLLSLRQDETRLALSQGAGAGVQ